MPRQDWSPEEGRRRDRDERDNDAFRDRDAGPGRRDDFGQVDYSSAYAYDPRNRTGYRADERRARDDDYATDFDYDPERGRGYRAFGGEPGYRSPERREEARRREDADEPRSWRDRAGDFFGGAASRDREPRRRGPSDRVLWTVIVQRLERARGLDLRDVEVRVEDGEVTLNGLVRRREDKRRIEDIADIEGVHNVQNNLRLRERRWFS